RAHAGQCYGRGGQQSGRPPKCPSSVQNSVRHLTGMVSVMIPESCPPWTGARIRARDLLLGDPLPNVECGFGHVSDGSKLPTFAPLLVNTCRGPPGGTRDDLGRTLPFHWE